MNFYLVYKKIAGIKKSVFKPYLLIFFLRVLRVYFVPFVVKKKQTTKNTKGIHKKH